MSLCLIRIFFAVIPYDGCKSKVLFPHIGKYSVDFYYMAAGICRDTGVSSSGCLTISCQAHEATSHASRYAFDSSQKHLAQRSKTLLIAGTNTFGSRHDTSAGNRPHRQTQPATPSERPPCTVRSTSLHHQELPSPFLLPLGRSGGAPPHPVCAFLWDFLRLTFASSAPYLCIFCAQ